MSSQDNQKLGKIIDQVDALSKTVDNLQKQVNDLKSSKGINNQNVKSENNNLVENSWKRLKFFGNKDKKETSASINGESKQKHRQSQTDADIDNLNLNHNKIKEEIPTTTRTNTSTKSTNTEKKRKHRQSQTNSDTDDLKLVNEQHKTLPSYQSNIRAEKIMDSLELICSVKTCAVQTDDKKDQKNQNRKQCFCNCEKHKEYSKQEMNKKLELKKKTSDEHKSSVKPKGRCAKGCSYFDTENQSSAKAKKFNDDDRDNDKKQCKSKSFKNKKVMVDLVNEVERICSKKHSGNNNTGSNCGKGKRENSRKNESSKTHKNKKCNCDTIDSKSQVKVKKVIVAKEPPIILVVSKENNC